jgi:hypothetical protein
MRLLSMLLLLTFFTSCQEDSRVLRTSERSEKIDFWSDVDYPNAIDYRSFILEGQLHFDYFIANEERFIEKILDIKDNASQEVNELNIKSITGSYSIVSASPFDFEENWVEYLDKIELIFISNEDGKEILIGKYTTDMPLYEIDRYRIEIEEEANCLEEIISSGGNFVYRFSFKSFPQNELKILHNQSEFLIEYELKSYN